MRIYLILLAMLLTSCLSAEEVQQREAAHQTRDSAECARQGAAPGTDAAQGCILRLKERRLQQRMQDTTITINPHSGLPMSNLPTDSNFDH